MDYEVMNDGFQCQFQFVLQKIAILGRKVQGANTLAAFVITSVVQI